MLTECLMMPDVLRTWHSRMTGEKLMKHLEPKTVIMIIQKSAHTEGIILIITGL